MVSHGSTVLDMATRKGGQSGNGKGASGGSGGRRKPPVRSPGYILYARIDPEIGAAFEEYLRVTEPTPSKTAAIELIFKRFLREVGLWPRPSGAAGKSPPDATD